MSPQGPWRGFLFFSCSSTCLGGHGLPAGNFSDVHAYPQPAIPGGAQDWGQVGIAAAGGLNASAQGFTGTLIRHCGGVGFAHRLDGRKVADASFHVGPALNGAVGAVSFESGNFPGSYLGGQASDGRIVRMGGTGRHAGAPMDKDAASFQMVAQLADGGGDSVSKSDVAPTVFSLKCLGNGSLAGTYLTQFAGDMCTVQCYGCEAPTKSNPTVNCTGDYVGVRPKAAIADPRLAAWSLLQLAPPPVPVKKTVAKVNGEYGGILLLPENLSPALSEWAPGKCHGYETRNNSSELTETFVSFAQAIAGLRHQGLSASIYTQITDCETECNGLLTYDRIIKPDAKSIKAANDALTIE